MTRDIVRDNIDCYTSTQALEDWSADEDLYEVERTIVADFFPAPPAKLLDLGCGAGRTTIALETRGYDVDALDLAAPLVGEARRRVRKARVHLMDARELAFPDASFDGALFSFNGLDCLHPSAERHRVLGEVFRALRPGAVFYYSGHNGLGAWAPRPGDSVSKVLRRNRDLLLAQRHGFVERSRYLAYPEPNGTQVLFSAPPSVHLRELRAAGFEPIALYGARGPSYRRGPHVLSRVDLDGRWNTLGSIAKLALTHPHVHYVAKKP